MAGWRRWLKAGRRRLLAQVVRLLISRVATPLHSQNERLHCLGAGLMPRGVRLGYRLPPGPPPGWILGSRRSSTLSLARGRFTVYHNPKCSKSQAALEIFEKSDAPYDSGAYFTSAALFWPYVPTCALSNESWWWCSRQ